MRIVSMLAGKGIMQNLVDFITGFFAFIPQIVYFFYTSAASLLDVLQYLVRKLAGLDVYYVNGVRTSGDIVTDFLKGIVGINKSTAYSALSTVFWSLVIFGVILLILTSIVSIIKAHYNYDANKSNPFTILRGALKSLATMAIVPIVAIFGVYLSQILLMTLDQITSPTSATALSATFEQEAVNKFASASYTSKSSDNDTETGEDEKKIGDVYTRYDYFSAGGYTKTPTFSGMMFRVAAYNCNRVRSGYYTANDGASNTYWDNMGVFYVQNNDANPHEVIAAQIDYAFVNNLKFKDEYVHKKVDVDGKTESDWLSTSLRWGVSATFSAGLYNVKSFSKFNVGLVFYYYDLWSFNSILGFAGVFLSAVTLGNIVFGLMGRLIQVVALFIVYPAFIGIMPLDDGSAFGKWRKEFMSNILMAFGAIVGMNIFFLILPFFNELSFFNVALLDGIANMIIILAGLTMVKTFMTFLSGAIGGGDANSTGANLRTETTNAAMKGMSGTLKASGLGVKIAGAGIKGAATGVAAIGRKAGEGASKHKIAKEYNKLHSSDPKKKFKDMSAEEIAETQNNINATAAQTAADEAVKKHNNKYGDGHKLAKKDEKIARKMGVGSAANVKDDDREAYDKFTHLDKTEQDAIMAGAYVTEKDEKGKDVFKTDDAGNKIALKGDALNAYLKSQLGTSHVDESGRLVGPTAKSQAAWVNHKGQQKLRRAKLVGGLFGQDISSYTAETATVNEETGEVQVTSGTKMMKGFGQAALDVTELLTKTVGSLTGVESAWKKLGEAGVIDEAKTNLQNLISVKPTANRLKGLRTKKQKSDEEDKELKKYREAQLEQLKRWAENTQKTREAIEDMANRFKNLTGGGS